MQSFFWLHIKKCGGQSFRETFSPYYVKTKRKEPHCQPFLSLPKTEWNDVLNNYRIPLGEYDFKRTLFAQKFLYSKNEFENMHKFTIVRNPYDRLVSAWKYLGSQHPKHKILLHPHLYKLKHNFKYFLSCIPDQWKSKKDRSFALHTAPIWADISDHNGNLLLDSIYYLEAIDEHLNHLAKKLEIPVSQFTHLNRNRTNNEYRKYYDSQSKKLVEELYGTDISNLNYTF